jgi:YVTN family beta-propeller protein
LYQIWYICSISGSNPCALCYNSQDNKVYCANYGDSSETVIDGASNQVDMTVAAGSRPQALCYNPQDNKVYCANYGSHNVTVIDGASNQVITFVGAGSRPYALCHNPQDDKAYCANYGSSNVTLIVGASDSVVKTMAVGMRPWAVTCNPAQNRVYVANYNSNSVSVIWDSALGAAERSTFTACHLTLEAYPNPFRGQVHLRLTAIGLRPEVRIYDVNGALVRAFPEIRDSPQRDRPRFLTWDGTDGMGRRLPPGIYVVRLTDGANSVNRKVMLLR